MMSSDISRYKRLQPIVSFKANNDDQSESLLAISLTNQTPRFDFIFARAQWYKFMQLILFKSELEVNVCVSRKCWIIVYH